jgi:hypothetical protein
MRFRVTSITSEQSGDAIAAVTVTLEKWLNGALADGAFGGTLEQLTFVVVSVDDDVLENERWVKTHEKLATHHHPITGETTRYLSLAVQLAPSLVANSQYRILLAEVSQRAIERLSVRPKRVPRGFDFARCAAAVSATLSVYAPVAA